MKNIFGLLILICSFSVFAEDNNCVKRAYISANANYGEDALKTCESEWKEYAKDKFTVACHGGFRIYKLNKEQTFLVIEMDEFGMGIKCDGTEIVVPGHSEKAG